MKRVIYTKVLMGALIVVIIGLIASIVVQNGGGGAGGDKKVVFGALVPLTGPVSVLGERMRNGAELAREDIINQNIIPNFEIDYQDACDGKSTTNAVRALVDGRGVRVISTGFCIFGMESVLDTLESKRVILFNTAANPENFLGRKYVFSTNVSISSDAQSIARRVFADGARRVAMIHLRTSFGESYRENFVREFESLGGVVLVSEPADPTTTDFRSSIINIKAVNPDALIIIHFGSPLGIAIKQTRELGLTIPLYGDYESEDATVVDFAGSAMDGYVFSSSEPRDDNSVISNFADRYNKRFGEFPDVLATNAYDAVVLQAKSYAKCEGDIDCMVTYLEKVSRYPGVSGEITIHAQDHSVKKQTIFKRVRGGAFIKDQ